MKQPLIHTIAHSDLDDLFDVQKELNPASAKWKSIGIALRLKPNTLDGINTCNNGDPISCLTSMVTEWVNRNYNVEKFGEPTWRWLVEAVGDPAGGANVALARDIARRHKTRGMPSRYIHIFMFLLECVANILAIGNDVPMRANCGVFFLPLLCCNVTLCHCMHVVHVQVNMCCVNAPSCLYILYIFREVSVK